MRARNIKPGFYRNEELAECSPPARLLFPGLWMLADREGRLEDRPRRIKGELFAFDTLDVEPLLVELEAHGFIARYRVGELRVIQVLTFSKHQNPHHREAPSTLPSLQSLGQDGDANRVQPEAGGTSEAHEAQGEPEALPAKVDLATPSSRADSLNPSSLNPSSLNPSSLNRDKPARASRKRGFDASMIELPPWLDQELWQRWCKDRKDRRNPVTEEAARLQLRSLADLRIAGHRPEDVIETSIAKGWSGLFEPTKNSGRRQPDLAAIDYSEPPR